MANPDVWIPRQHETIGHSIESHPRPVIRVLAVDDEPAACKLIAILLRPPAFYCTTAPNGEAAIGALQLDRFNAVISDLQMPGISGLELLNHVRRSYPNVAPRA
ncbi:MAG TPA: response regulator [Candidatus Acidoferrum sp.]